MVKGGKGKEVDDNSAASQKKSKKKKRKSTFYSFSAHPDRVPESLPPSPSTPESTHTEDEPQNIPEGELEWKLTDDVDSVDAFDLNFEVKTRQTENHWYMIYYDGSIDIPDDDDSDGVENSGDSLQSPQQLPSGCPKSSDFLENENNDEMVCGVICYVSVPN